VNQIQHSHINFIYNINRVGFCIPCE